MHLLIAFFLLQNITISGTLKDANGKPPSGVRVAAMPVVAPFPFLKNILGAVATNTDKDGRYTLELPPGAYYVVAGDLSGTTYSSPIGSKVAISTSQAGVDFVASAASFSAASFRPVLREELPPRPRPDSAPMQWDVPPTPPKFPPRPR